MTYQARDPALETTRRGILRLVGGALLGAGALASSAAARHGETYPGTITLSYDEATIQDYQPQFILAGVEPKPIGFYALHATSSEHDVNVVAGFTFYSQQSGTLPGGSDSHLGDHEPIYVYYDKNTGEITNVRYAAYHWFRATAARESVRIADPHRPIMRVHPDYHHYLVDGSSRTGELIETKDLLGAIEGWLDNGLESELALSQPHNPYDMIGRESWWRHSSTNWLDATAKAIGFNLGLAPAAGADSDLNEVSAW